MVQKEKISNIIIKWFYHTIASTLAIESPCVKVNAMTLHIFSSFCIKFVSPQSCIPYLFLIFSSMPSERYMKRRKKKAKFVAITCIYSVIICSHGISINFACLASRSIFISFFFPLRFEYVHSMHKWAYGLLFCGPANKIRIKKKIQQNNTIEQWNVCY